MFFSTIWKGEFLWKNWIRLNNSFFQTSKRGHILTQSVFVLKVSHIQLNSAFVLFWRIFGEIHWKLLFLVKKVTISERSSEILRKFVFLKKFENGQIFRKIWICLNNFFDQSSKRGQILTITVIFCKLSQIQVNYTFVLFWSSLGKFQKIEYLRKKLRNTQKVCFSQQVWKVANQEENLDLFKQLFLVEPVKGDTY